MKAPENNYCYIVYNTTQKWVTGGVHKSLAAAQKAVEDNSFGSDSFAIYECFPILKTGRAEKRVWS